MRGAFIHYGISHQEARTRASRAMSPPSPVPSVILSLKYQSLRCLQVNQHRAQHSHSVALPQAILRDGYVVVEAKEHLRPGALGHRRSTLGSTSISVGFF